MAILGLAVGARKVRAAIIDEKYTVTAFGGTDVECKESPVACAADLALGLLEKENVAKADIVFVGAAVCTCAGDADSIAAELESKLGMPVKATSSINALTLGEAYVNTGDVSSAIVMKFCEDKIESGIVLDRKVFANYAKIGGGLGHTVINNGGYKCSCGRTGCLEAYTTSAGIRHIAGDAGSSHTTLSAIFDAADQGDEGAIAAKNAYVSHLACGLTNVINLFQPHELIIMGELTALGDRLMAPLMDIVLREQYTKHSPNKGKVRFSAPDPKVVLVGAALLGR